LNIRDIFDLFTLRCGSFQLRNWSRIAFAACSTPLGWSWWRSSLWRLVELQRRNRRV